MDGQCVIKSLCKSCRDDGKLDKEELCGGDDCSEIEFEEAAGSRGRAKRWWCEVRLGSELRAGVWDLLDEKRFFRWCCNGDDGGEIEKQKQSEKREDLSKHSQGIAGIQWGSNAY